MSTVLVYCREMCESVLVICRGLCRDSRLHNLDEVFTSFCRTPLHIAVMCGDVEFSKIILSKRPDLALKEDRLGFTPLHHASARRNLQMVKLLLKAKPDACMVQDKDGRTPLHLAAMKNRVEIMKLLMKERPEGIHSRNNQNGETILHFCVKSNTNFATLKLLVDRLVLALAQTSYPNPISIDSKDNDGNTVLHLVAVMGKIKMVNWLLQSNNLRIDIDAINNKGLKALNLLSQVERDDLEIGFHNHFGHTKELMVDETLSDNKDHHKQVKRKSRKKSGHRERVDALLVVATLIAGIAFQAMVNPPGGVWQDDSQIDSGTDPVKFAYYLRCMFGSSVSDNLDSYIRHNVLKNSTKRGVWEVYSKTQEIVHHFIDNLVHSTAPYTSTTKGLIVEDYTGDIVAAYNSSDGGGNFFPYLIRYAGFPVMAYKHPKHYVTYMLTNTMAFSLSLTIVFAVICGFVHEKSVAQNRILVLLMCISIGCISYSYFSILFSMIPDFLITNQANLSIFQYFAICGICGIGLLLWNVISRMVKLHKRHLTVFHYFKMLFSMDASAAGKLVLLLICIFLLYNYLVFGTYV